MDVVRFNDGYKRLQMEFPQGGGGGGGGEGKHFTSSIGTQGW